MEKLFVVTFTLDTGTVIAVDCGFVFAMNQEEAGEKSLLLMNKKWKGVPTCLQQIIQIDNRLLIKAYNLLNN